MLGRGEEFLGEESGPQREALSSQCVHISSGDPGVECNVGCKAQWVYSYSSAAIPFRRITLDKKLLVPLALPEIARTTMHQGRRCTKRGGTKWEEAAERKRDRGLLPPTPTPFHTTSGEGWNRTVGCLERVQRLSRRVEKSWEVLWRRRGC